MKEIQSWVMEGTEGGGGSESKVGNESGFTKICCIKANLCYPFSVVNINAPFLRHILKRIRENCANEKVVGHFF